MSPRPRQASDEDILKAAFRAIARLGPAKLTLADVAGEAGLSAAALVGLAECMALLGTTPSAIANNLSFFHLDVGDADFHRHALTASQGMHAGIKALVRDAMATGELERCDPDRLASALQATLNGSLLNWTVHRQGGLVDWIRRDVRTVVAPFRTGRRR